MCSRFLATAIIGSQARAHSRRYDWRAMRGVTPHCPKERKTMPGELASTRFLNPQTLPRPFGYSQIVEVRGGRTVYISGQVPLDANNELVGTGDFGAQVRQAFANLEAALAAVDMTFANVVKLQFFVTDVADLPALRAIRDEYLDPARQPASTLVQVSALFRPDVLFEVDAVATG
jgi:enamine deaminase RidA (YjgF/YER057c/UK114 family)